MAGGYFGFYEDDAKVTEIITSKHFVSKGKRDDFIKGGSYRLVDGTQEVWYEYKKYEEIITCTDVSLTDRNLLIAEFDLHRSFYYYPDVINNSTEYYQVQWIDKKFPEKFNRLTQKFTIKISIKED